MNIKYCINPDCNNELIGKQLKFCSILCKNKISNATHQSSEQQKKRGVLRKIELVKLCGDKCGECGYNKNLAALEFHHLDPSQKEDGLNMKKLCNCTWDFCLSEVKKCILLCANCHRALHNPNFNDFMEKFANNDISSFTKIIHKEPGEKDVFCQCRRKISQNESQCTKCIKKEQKMIDLIIKQTCKCGNDKNIKSDLCRECFLKEGEMFSHKPKLELRRVARPTKEELQILVWEIPMTKIGERFGVSDNSIRKWCKSYGITNLPERNYWQKMFTQKIIS